MFLKLLGSVLKAGNGMNIGTNLENAPVFKLDTLLKLLDVKCADGKTTLLQFVVEEAIRDDDLISPLGPNEEVESRKRKLQAVTNLTGELSNVTKATEIDPIVLSSEVDKLANQIRKVKHILEFAEEIPAGKVTCKFIETITMFLKKAEAEIARIQAQRNTTLTMAKEVNDYFHGDDSKQEANPFRIFLVVRDFLIILDRVCKEVGKLNMRSIMGSGNAHSLYYGNPNLQYVLPPFIWKQQSVSAGDQRSSSMTYGLAHSSSI